jgi:lipopolysaccharide export LptBFGC system permease protein LptF
MRTLDRYVVRSFLWSAVLLFLAIMALRVVADLFLNIDEFIESDQPVGEVLRHIGTYYGYQSLMYLSELGGVIIVAAAAFTLARMNHTNELTAMLASGVSLYRVILPIVLCAMGMGGLVILDRELLIPPNAARLARTRDEGREFSRFPVRLMADGGGTVWYSPLYDPATRTMAYPVLPIRDEEDRLIASPVSLGEGRPAELDGRRGWDLTDASLSRAGAEAGSWLRTPNTQRIYTHVGPAELLAKTKELARRHGVAVLPDEQIRKVWGLPPVLDRNYGMTISARLADKTAPQLALDSVRARQPRGGRLHRPRFTYRTPKGKLLGIFHADAAVWVPGAPDESHWRLVNGRLFYPSDLTHEDLVLRQSSRWLDYMSTAQLTRLLALNRVPDRGGAQLARHVRFADPINNLVMLLLALPFILSRERNLKASAALCLLMVGTYFAFVYLCRLVGLHPVIAAFLPIGLFGTVAVVMLDAIQT